MKPTCGICHVEFKNNETLVSRGGLFGTAHLDADGCIEALVAEVERLNNLVKSLEQYETIVGNWNSRNAPATRRNDHETSEDAAEKVLHMSAMRERILECFWYYGPMTDERLREVFKQHVSLKEWKDCAESTVRKRRHELCVMGSVEDTGGTATNALGNKMKIWAITNSGREWIDVRDENDRRKTS